MTADHGCRFWRECRSCPFPRCLYEEPGGPHRAFRAHRDRVIRRLFAEGDPAPRLAEQFGVGRGTVYRALGGIRRRRVRA